MDDDDRAARRARREERRALQRANNIVRAKAMHVTRLKTYEKKLKDTAAELDSSTTPTDAAFRANVGCSGWYYWHWANAFYPAELPKSLWFDHYADRFQTVELNAPFYSWPTLSTVRTWIRQAKRRKFVYTIKVNELITHTKRFSGTSSMVKDFGFIAELLGKHFGCFLFQLPPSFHYSSAHLARILKQLDHRWRNVIEFRHPSWWNEKVYRAFEENETIFCSISAPRLPNDLIKTTDDLYIRFHGTLNWYRHDYTKQELAVWTEHIQESKAKRLWAYFNNDRDGYAIKNARELIRQLKRKID